MPRLIVTRGPGRWRQSNVQFVRSYLNNDSTMYAFKAGLSEYSQSHESLVVDVVECFSSELSVRLMWCTPSFFPAISC